MDAVLLSKFSKGDSADYFALLCSALKKVYLHLLSDWGCLRDWSRRSSFFLEGVAAELHGEKPERKLKRLDVCRPM